MHDHDPLLNSRPSPAPDAGRLEVSRVLQTSGAPPEPSPPAQSFLGREIGGFRVDELVGAGGFSLVFRAKNLASGETVALKLPRAEGLIEHLRREAVVAGRFVDPQVVAIREAHLDHEPPFLVMPFVEGRDLALPPEAPPPEEIIEAFKLFRGIAEVVARMHEAGVVHGDLKPGNLRIEAGSRCHVLDFGLAQHHVAVRQVSSLRASVHSVTGEKLAGTLEYMAPEVLAGDKPGPPADVFALGVILHQLLCGRPPAFGVSPSALNPFLPPGFSTFLRTALHHDPASRFPRAGALLPAIDAFIRAEAQCLVRRDGHARRRVAMERMRTLAGGARVLFWVAALCTVVAAAAWAAPFRAEEFKDAGQDSPLFLAVGGAVALGFVGLLLGVTTINAWIWRVPAKTYKERPGHRLWSFMMQ
ncbi:MAG: serine/threonine protein kinase [Planctomycetes bacterium]|nr:serine/threonine protein kinase [Planctomycetota bacterium]